MLCVVVVVIAVGDKYTPYQHDMVERRVVEEGDDNVILEVHGKGYQTDRDVIR